MKHCSRNTERRRVREVRKYYNRSTKEPPAPAYDDIEPILSGHAATRVESPDTTLTALMQLIAWRLGMQRAMVSVVDENAQYFLAEATKSLDLENPARHETGDALWMGCGSTDRSEALCANTIEVPRSPGTYACFSVSDLSKDPRFCNLSYVTGGPKFRFYAGTPLLSKDDIPIGSVFVIDDRPRGPPLSVEIDFLGIMARNVMDYLELKRGSVLRERNELMTRGLAALVEGQSTIPPFDHNDIFHAFPPKGQSLELRLKPAASRLSPVVTSSIPASVDRQPWESAKTTLMNIKEISDPSVGDKTASRYVRPWKSEDREATPDRIFARACKLLREALDADLTVFYDIHASVAIDRGAINGHADPLNQDDHAASQAAPSMILTDIDASPGLLGNHNAFPEVKSLNGDSPLMKDGRSPLAQVMCFSTHEHSLSMSPRLLQAPKFHAPELQLLGNLLKNYPLGKLWALGNDDDSSEEEEEETPLMHPESHSPVSSPPKRETSFLSECFPGATQILFAPLWEAGKANATAASFTVSWREAPLFRSEKEIAFVRAFLNTVSIEVSRVAILAADRQKGDFISSISHELRSPLHGIIASAELLADSRLDRRQEELTDTIETCSRVLLETISAVLDYTKINNLRRESRDPLKGFIREGPTRRDSATAKAGNKALIPDDFEFSEIDVAKICEESVTVVATAYLHNTSKSDLSSYSLHVKSSTDTGVQSSVPLPDSSVALVVNIQSANWQFRGLPGAVQRIIMNLVGNSLKYTKSGYIKVDLTIEGKDQESYFHLRSEPQIQTIVLTVSDTGKGISNDFLHTKLFTPFSQESTLTPGTGLGLNMVKSLVHLQHGIIDIHSQVGKGTTVIVKLPLQQTRDDSPCLVLNRSSPVEIIGAQQIQESFALYGFQSSTARILKSSISDYLTKWFDKTITTMHEAKVVIVCQDDLTDCLNEILTFEHTPLLIVICHPTSQEHLLKRFSTLSVTVELLVTPFGPQKLSKILKICSSTLKAKPAYGIHPAPMVITPPPEEKPESLTEIVIPPPNRRLSDGISNLSISSSVTLVSAPETTTQSLKVLCVDDNPINLRLLKTYMERLNYSNVFCAINGAEAFDVVRHHDRFDLIFMDLSMPVCDGFEAISLIRLLENMSAKLLPEGEKPKPALIVALTGLASQRDQDAAVAAGADHFVTKPLKLSMLKQLLIEWKVRDG